MTDMPAVFITFEGTDGCGKSTQFVMAANALKKIAKQPVTATREPGGTTVSERIREILLDKEYPVLPTAELLLFAAARAQVVHQIIRPALNMGHIVLCDRYIHSTLAYQGARFELGTRDIQQSIEIATNGLLPDITFLFDLPVEAGLARRGKDTNRMDEEAIEYHNRVRANYHKIAQNETGRFVVIDATQSIDAIHYAVMLVLMNPLTGVSAIS